MFNPENINTPQELKNLLAKDNPDIVLLDVRTKNEYDTGNIESSINFELSGLDFMNKLNQLNKDKTYIVYCLSGSRSKLDSLLMKQKGFKVTNCNFGFKDFE